MQSGLDIFNIVRGYGEFGSDEFMEKFGYVNGEWLDDYKKVKLLDKDGNVVKDKDGNDVEYSLKKEQARQAFLAFHDKIISVVNQLSPSIRPYFENYINSPIWSYGDPTKPQSKEGSTVTLDGVKYTFTNGEWVPDNKGMPHMTDAAMQKKLVAQDNGTPITTTTTTDGSKSSDYKSHYNNNSAAPKQVIVKIENLMNVESVDLSNPDNAAVIADLKGQLTQALVDVVHDFDETYHG